MALLHSFGIAGLSEHVLQQLASKCPQRAHPVPAALPVPAPPAITVQLTEVFRALRRRAGTGVSGRRNEYLRALVGTFGDPLADRVMPAYDAFATEVANARLPPWFYSAFAIAGLHPLLKHQYSPEQREQGAEPDVRPISPGEVDLRAILSSLTAAVAPAAAEILAPQQLAVGVSGGISVLIHGVRLTFELNGTFVGVRVDLRNGFNAQSRAVALRRMASHPRLAHLVPLLHALGATETHLLVGALKEPLFQDDPTRGDSSEGWLQGGPSSSLGFCVGIHPEAVALDAELAPFGGCARLITDDLYALGPPAVVFPAVTRFAERLRASTGLEVTTSKCACYSPAFYSGVYDLEVCPWRQQAGIAIGTVDPAMPYIQGAATGIMVGGVPIGDDEYIEAVLDQEVDGIVSCIEKTTSELRATPHCLWSCLTYSLAPKFDYWLRHMPPVQTVNAAARVDRALLATARELGYDSIFHDAITQRRLRLPVRMRGCGLRSRVWLAPIAYASSFVEAAEA